MLTIDQDQHLVVNTLAYEEMQTIQRYCQLTLFLSPQSSHHSVSLLYTFRGSIQAVRLQGRL